MSALFTVNFQDDNQDLHWPAARPSFDEDNTLDWREDYPSFDAHPSFDARPSFNVESDWELEEDRPSFNAEHHWELPAGRPSFNAERDWELPEGRPSFNAERVLHWREDPPSFLQPNAEAPPNPATYLWNSPLNPLADQAEAQAEDRLVQAIADQEFPGERLSFTSDPDGVIRIPKLERIRAHVRTHHLPLPIQSLHLERLRELRQSRVPAFHDDSHLSYVPSRHDLFEGSDEDDDSQPRLMRRPRRLPPARATTLREFGMRHDSPLRRLPTVAPRVNDSSSSSARLPPRWRSLSCATQGNPQDC